MSTVYCDVSKQTAGVSLGCRSVKVQQLFLSKFSKILFIFMYFFHDFKLL